MNAKYEELLELPHPNPKRHPRMPMADRAAQFSPFAALTGFETILAEAEQTAVRNAEWEGNQVEATQEWESAEKSDDFFENGIAFRNEP